MGGIFNAQTMFSSLMGGGGGGNDVEGPSFDSRDLRQELSMLRDPNSPEALRIKGMIGGQLSDTQANAFAMQSKASQSGIDSARRIAQQTAREGSAARGLFSSDIALGAEAAGLANVENQYAQSQANVYGQQGQAVQQGILSGLQASQNRASLRANLAGSIASGQYQASSAQSSLQQQQQQAQQAQQGQMIQSGASMGASLLPLLLSDESLKEDIKDIDNALDIVKQLNGKSFKWRETKEDDFGVIAQELEKVLPQLVKKQDGIKKVSYTSLIGILINAVKELSDKMEV